MVGEEFPNVLGNDSLRNAVAGTLGLVLAVGFGWFANIPAHPGIALAAGALGGLVMAVFHGRRGAYRLNTALGRSNPVTR